MLDVVQCESPGPVSEWMITLQVRRIFTSRSSAPVGGRCNFAVSGHIGRRFGDHYSVLTGCWATGSATAAASKQDDRQCR